MKKILLVVMIAMIASSINATEKTYTFTSFTSAQDVVLTDEPLTITLSKGSGSTNPAWSSNQARVYAKGSVTIECTKTMTSIQFNYAVNANSKGKSPSVSSVEGSTNTGTWNEGNKTWTGSDTEVTLSTTGDAGNLGFTSVVVSYEEGPTCTDPATALSITSAATATVGTPLSLTTTGGNGGTVTWSVTNGTGTATVDGSTLTPETAGTVTVKAHQELNGTTCAQDAELEVTISRQTASFTFSDGYVESTTYYVGDSYTLPSTTTAECGDKIFVGWSTVEISTPGDKPTSNYYDKGTDVTLVADNSFYAVFAESSGGTVASLTKLGSSDSFSDGDKIVIVANVDNGKLMYQETVSTSYVAYKQIGSSVGQVPLTVAGISADDKNWFTLTAGTGDNAGKWRLGDATNGYINVATNNLYCNSTESYFTIVWNSDNNGFTIKDGTRWIGCRADLTGDNQYKWRGAGNQSSPTTNSVCYLDIYRLTGGATYSNYSTVCGPSYTITATRNNAELGSVSLTGKVITATPNECVGYAAPAYSVTSGSATVVQEGNNFRVTPTSDCTIQINFVATVEDTYIDDVQDWEASVKYCGSYEAPSITDKTTNRGTGVCETDHYHFVGWTTNEYRNRPAGHITAAGTDMTGSGTTYYAVWAKEE